MQHRSCGNTTNCTGDEACSNDVHCETQFHFRPSQRLQYLRITSMMTSQVCFTLSFNGFTLPGKDMSAISCTKYAYTSPLFKFRKPYISLFLDCPPNSLLLDGRCIFAPFYASDKRSGDKKVLSFNQWRCSNEFSWKSNATLVIPKTRKELALLYVLLQTNG